MKIGLLKTSLMFGRMRYNGFGNAVMKKMHRTPPYTKHCEVT